MRRPERIPIILEALEDHDNLLLVVEKLAGDTYKFTEIVDSMVDIKRVWENSPDSRFAQTLICMGLIPDGPMWFIEDEELFIDLGILEERDIYFWGKRYTKDGKIMPNYEFVLIKDMETSHIKSILRDNEEGLMKTSKKYLEMFNRELNYRRTYNID